MSDKFTAIALRGVGGSGLAEWGDKTVPEMIAIYRKYHRDRLKASKQVLSASDEDFCVQSYIGVHVQRNRKVLQEGRQK